MMGRKKESGYDAEGVQKWREKEGELINGRREKERERREQRPSVGVNASLLPLGLRCHGRDRKVSHC